jgi:hypothetical protein
MNEIDPLMLAEVLAELSIENDSNKFSVPVDELFLRLIEKGYKPSQELLDDIKGTVH